MPEDFSVVEVAISNIRQPLPSIPIQIFFPVHLDLSAVASHNQPCFCHSRNSVLRVPLYCEVQSSLQ